MRKTVITLCSLVLIVVALKANRHSISQQSDGDEKQSPFVGTWEWTENTPQWQSFAIWVGERNDSLLFCMGGTFHGGRKIQMPENDKDGNIIPVVKTQLPKGNLVKSKISEAFSNFYFDQDRMRVYNDISFELINDCTMLFILDDNKGYWPDTAVMIRRDRINRKFSDYEEPLLYKGK